MTGQQAAILQARQAVELGEWPQEEINVLVIRIMGVRLVQGKMPREVRSELSRAVKEGTLGYLPKNKLEPAAYFHPNSRGKAIEQRRQVAYEAMRSIAGIVARPFEVSNETE